MRKVEKFLFGSEGLEDTYEGYTEGVIWKGYECPYFSKEVSEKVISDLIAIAGTTVLSMYDSENDRFFIISYCSLSSEKIEQLKDINAILKLSTQDLRDIYDADVFEKETIIFEGESKVVYGIGAYCWIWEKR